MTKSYPEIGCAEAGRALAQYLVVDVREPHEYTGELGHIPGSRLLPLGELFAAIERGEARRVLFGGGDERALLMVCRSGNRSGQACARLAAAGVPGATNLAGGMLEWNRLGLAVERPGGGGPSTSR